MHSRCAVRAIWLQALSSLIVACGVFVLAGDAVALQANPRVSTFHAGNAVVLPFDVSSRQARTALTIANVGGVSPGIAGTPYPVVIPMITTHWVFYDGDDSIELAGIPVCMPLGSSVTLDARRFSSLDANHLPQGPVIDLSGRRGFVVVTAYATNASCDNNPPYQSPSLVDNAIVGRFAISEKAGRGYGTAGETFGLDATKTFTTLPETGIARLDAMIRVGRSRKLTFSRVVLMALQEQQGSSPFGSRPEIGPAVGSVTMNAIYRSVVDSTQLPSVNFARMLFTSATESVSGLVPAIMTLEPSGTLELSDIKVAAKPVGAGNRTYVVGFHGQSVDSAPSTEPLVESIATP